MALIQRVRGAVSAIASRAQNLAAIAKSNFRARGGWGGVGNRLLAKRGEIAMSLTPMGRVGQIGKTIYGGARTLAQRALGNPLAGMAFKEGLKKFAGQRAGQALGAATFLTAIDVTAKDALSFKDIARTTIGAALNPIGAIVGTAIRGGKAAYNVASGIPELLNPRVITDFNLPQTPNIFVKQAPITFEQAPINMVYPESQGSSIMFSPSISGGGGGDITPLLLALLGGGALGFAVGRKRRKKYKRRKSRK